MNRCLLAGFAVAGIAAAALAGEPQRATFDVRHELQVKVPEGVKQLQAWFALPQDDPTETVTDLKIEAPVAHRVTRDSEGNQMLFLEAKDPKPGDLNVVATFRVARSEVKSNVDPTRTRPINDAERSKYERFLQANQNVVINDEVRRLAATIVKDEKNPIKQARSLYDWTLKNIDYWVKDPNNKKASPVGSSEYCLSTKTGNCTDFHSLWASLARAVGIPTRIVYGSFFKAELDGQDVDQSYHCWIEFFAPEAGWIPLDVSVADIYVGDFSINKDNETLVRRTTPDGYRGPEPQKVDYYFGNLDARRVTWSTGRDLVLEPKPAASPINALPKAYVEVDGKALAEKTGWTRKLTYHELKS